MVTTSERSIYVEWWKSGIRTHDRFYELLTKLLPEGTKVYGYLSWSKFNGGWECGWEYGAVILYPDGYGWNGDRKTLLMDGDPLQDNMVVLPDVGQTVKEFVDEWQRHCKIQGGGSAAGGYEANHSTFLDNEGARLDDHDDADVCWRCIFGERIQFH
jgi:hypothetical protein